MLHKETLITAVNYFKAEPMQKAYIQVKLENMNNEFISCGVFNGILEDATLEQKRVYNLDGDFIDFALYQFSTGKLLTYGEGFKEYKKEGYELKVLHNSNAVILIHKNNQGHKN